MAILMEEGYWRNSPLSIARFYGGIQVKGGLSDDGKVHQMKVVDERGITLEELSDPQSKHYVGDGMAIKPGKPADLIDEDFIRYYKKLGRDRFIAILEEHRRESRRMLHSIFKDAVKQSKYRK